MKYQFMPMFWGDFFANTLHLTAQELGAYTALIGHAWEHDGNIAVEDLRRVARVGNNHWFEIRARLEQFFTPMVGVPGDPHGGGGYWHHSRVYQELTKAAEIANKRKDAALQMHSKSRASAHANTPPSTLQLPIEKLSNGKGSEAPQEKVVLPPVSNYRDPGNDYRSPPKTKPDAPLQPLPEKLR